MKVLVIGSEGFVGRNVAAAFDEAEHEVYRASRSSEDLPVDLSDQASIAQILESVRPDVVVNAAGIVGASDNVMDNVTFTANLLRQIAASRHPVKRVIISGSAAEYGTVDPQDLPVDEDTPVKAQSGYALSKAQEIQQALSFATEHGLPVTVARIFNPIGPGMHSRFLVPRILQQIEDVRSGMAEVIAVSRLDSERDYLDVRDLGRAIVMLAEGNPKRPVYNIGSGRATSNGELIDLMLRGSGLGTRPQVVETMPDPEPPVASQADITQIEQEFGWSPTRPLSETIGDIIDEARRQN